MKLTYAQSRGIAFHDSIIDCLHSFDSHDYHPGFASMLMYYLVKHFGDNDVEFKLIGDHSPSKIVKDLASGRGGIKKKMRKNVENALAALKTSSFLDFKVDENDEISIKLNHSMFHLVA